ncbi:glycine n-acyltransferase-like protein [Plakobranchus ocellatus]|uniref:Glycine n-acyltransferase-like protein n=1 Tax=Plakobranchus ocellatus TaxID=259542 RepID=A0AAV4BLH7_9GAST|nr:glycine n-acyltransferase-like protein [Plakobranchus ocellatus]
MEPISLHPVTEVELPQIKDWLEQFLPDSLKLYWTVRNMIQGRWQGSTLVTLGWPDILAVGEGPIPEDSPCYEFHASSRRTSVFSPDPEHLETLLLYPDYLDWSKPIIFQGVNKQNRPVLDKIIEAKGNNCHIDTFSILEAGQEELPPRSVPEGLELRALDCDLDIDYITSTRYKTRDGEASYIKELIKRFPSVGLFDENNKCIGLELGKENGTLGMLHVREEFRGCGLGKVITSQLAQKYFRDDLPVTVLVPKDNEVSWRMHTSCGFRKMGDLDWMYYNTGCVM